MGPGPFLLKSDQLSENPGKVEVVFKSPDKIHIGLTVL